jgi:hypothetical protein
VPSAKKHLRNAERHYRSAVATSGSEITRAWGAVALFYSAHQLVHAVLDGEMGLAEEMRHPESHGTGHGGPLGTNTLVARTYRHIDLEYKSLFATGKAVRYSGATVTEDDFAQHLTQDYSAIATWARTELQKRGRTLPADWP